MRLLVWLKYSIPSRRAANVWLKIINDLKFFTKKNKDSNQGNLAVAVVWLNSFDIFDVEITEAVRLQIECNEDGHVIKTVLDVGERVACNPMDFVIVPDA